MYLNRLLEMEEIVGTGTVAATHGPVVTFGVVAVSFVGISGHCKVSGDIIAHVFGLAINRPAEEKSILHA